MCHKASILNDMTDRAHYHRTRLVPTHTITLPICIISRFKRAESEPITDATAASVHVHRSDTDIDVIFQFERSVHRCFLHKPTTWFSELPTAAEIQQLRQCSSFSDSGSSQLSALCSHTLHSRPYPCMRHSHRAAFNVTLHLNHAKEVTVN